MIQFNVKNDATQSPADNIVYQGVRSLEWSSISNNLGMNLETEEQKYVQKSVETFTLVVAINWSIKYWIIHIAMG